MQQRIIPKTGESLPTLGYGCMRFPMKNGRIDVEETKKQVHYAIDHGVTYLDTAWIYHKGASEGFLGQHILTDGYREKVQIATKLPCYLVRKASQFDEFFNKQLERLQVDYIDYYLLHALNGATFQNMIDLGILPWLDKLKADGKVKNIGFSFHDRYEAFTPICDAYDWDFCQVQFNIIDEHFQAGIKGIRYAHSKGMGVIIMEPLRGGTLVTRLPSEVKSLYSKSPIQRTPADWGLRWILDHEEVTMVLSGMNDMDHIKANIHTADTTLPNGLSPEEKSIIDSVSETFHRLLTVTCTACQYCMPCPAGIDIPGSFKSLNDANMFGKVAPRFFHARACAVQTKDGKSHWSTACINCGKCEKVCPQHLPVRAHLKEVHETLEGPYAKVLAFGMNIFTQFGFSKNKKKENSLDKT